MGGGPFWGHPNVLGCPFLGCPLSSVPCFPHYYFYLKISFLQKYLKNPVLCIYNPKTDDEITTTSCGSDHINWRRGRDSRSFVPKIASSPHLPPHSSIISLLSYVFKGFFFKVVIPVASSVIPAKAGIHTTVIASAALTKL